MGNGRTDSEVRLKRWFCIIEILSQSTYPLSIKGNEKHSGLYPRLVDEEFAENPAHLSQTQISSEIRKIKRDLEKLEELGYVISNTASKPFTYSYNRESSTATANLMKLALDNEMIQAFLLSRDMFKLFEGTELVEAIDRFYSTLSEVYGGEVTPMPIEKKFGPRRLFSEEQSCALDELIYACNNSLEVKMRYRIAYKGRVESIQVKPHKLIQYNDSFYLVALDKSEEFKMYNLCRFTKVDVLDLAFVKRSTDEFDRKLRDSFGVHTGGEKRNVIITFDKKVHQALLEREWHASSKVKETENGVLLRMNVLVNDELAGWIRSWGENVVDVEPSELKTLVNKSLDIKCQEG